MQTVIELLPARTGSTGLRNQSVCFVPYTRISNKICLSSAKAPAQAIDLACCLCCHGQIGGKAVTRGGLHTFSHKVQLWRRHTLEKSIAATFFRSMKRIAFRRTIRHAVAEMSRPACLASVHVAVVENFQQTRYLQHLYHLLFRNKISAVACV